MKRDPGATWRLLAQDGSDRVAIESSGRPPFDELVVGQAPGEAWIHVERMDSRMWFVQLGCAIFSVDVRANGEVRVTLTEGTVGPGGRIQGGRA